MIIQTKFMGELEISENDIINFEYGLPGFFKLHDFVLIPIEDNLYYLQSIEEASVCFIVVVPGVIASDYDIEISDDTVECLKIEKAEDVALYAIINARGDSEGMTVNLKAPIIVNTKNNKAAQELLTDERFEIKHKIAREA